MLIYKLDNGFDISIDVEKASIVSIKKEEEFIQGDISFYSVKLRDNNGKTLIINADSGRFVAFDGKSVLYTHKEIDVCVHIEQSQTSLIWRIDVKNKTDLLLEWVELMSIGVCKKLKDEIDGKGSIVMVYNEGVEVTNMQQRENTQFAYIEPDYPSLGRYFVFPYKMASQFESYLLNGKGIYMGMHDIERTPKHIDFCYYNNSIKMQMRVYCNCNYGEDYSMNFDSVLSFFDGGWEDACEIYREWFENNLPENTKKINERVDLPTWYDESPLVVAYPIRGAHDTDEMLPNGMFPYNNAIPYLQRIAEATNSKVMALLMQWEGTAPWAPPYVWPPYGGVEIFEDFISNMHKNDMLIGVYGSGIGWTQYSKVVPSYNCEQEFIDEKLSEIMCSDTDNRLEGGICRDQRLGYDFCAKNERTKSIIEKEWANVLKYKLDYVQAFDQNHGGCTYFCYNKHHEHIPAPGKWQIEESLSLIKRIKNSNKDIILGCETSTSEPFLGELLFSDNRYELNYYIGLPIPMYSYIYHEYINNFMGNQVGMNMSLEKYSLTYRLAYSFLAGDMLTIIINDKGEIAYSWGRSEYLNKNDRDIALKFIKTLNKWKTNKTKDFLHFGKMTKSVKISCGKNKFTHIKNDNVLVDKILTSAYALGEKKLQFIVNYNDYPIDIVLDKKVKLYKNAEMTDVKQDVSSFTIQPLSVYSIEI